MVEEKFYDVPLRFWRLPAPCGIPIRYSENVTGLLEQVLRRVEALSDEEQDAIAPQILETLNDKE